MNIWSSRVEEMYSNGSVGSNRGTLMVQKDSTGMLLWFTRVE